jgi:hypothetical protein
MNVDSSCKSCPIRLTTGGDTCKSDRNSEQKSVFSLAALITGEKLSPSVTGKANQCVSEISMWRVYQFRITMFFFGGGALFIVRYSKKYKTQRFGNWICFRPQVRGRDLLCWVS